MFYVKDLLCEYPNIEELKLYLLQIIYSYTLINKEEVTKEDFDFVINGLDELTDSINKNVVFGSSDFLYLYYMSICDYDKADFYLNKLDKNDPDTKRKYSELNRKIGKIQESYVGLEELLLYYYKNLSSVFLNLINCSKEDGDERRTKFLAEKYEIIKRGFDMENTSLDTTMLEISIKNKDKEGTLQNLNKLVDGFNEISSFIKSPLYEHMEFKNIDGEYMKTMINASLNNLLNEKDVDFIERDELIKIIKRLK